VASLLAIKECTSDVRSCKLTSPLIVGSQGFHCGVDMSGMFAKLMQKLRGSINTTRRSQNTPFQIGTWSEIFVFMGPEHTTYFHSDRSTKPLQLGLPIR